MTPQTREDITPGRSSEPSEKQWYILILLAIAELFGMSLWFTASAVSSHLQTLWNLDGSHVGWLTKTVQIGFVACTALAAVLNFADRTCLPVLHRLFPGGGLPAGH